MTSSSSPRAAAGPRTPRGWSKRSTKTRRADTHVHIAVDEDDPALPEYRKAVRVMGDGDEFETGPRGGLAEWTNRIAVRRAGEYRYLAVVR